MNINIKKGLLFEISSKRLIAWGQGEGFMDGAGAAKNINYTQYIDIGVPKKKLALNS